MATSTAIDIINASCNELGLPTVSLNSATGDTIGTQSLALLNALGDELTRVHDWQFLEQVMTFIGDGVQQTFPLPDGFKRQINQTQWAATDMRPMIGPLNAQMWSWTQYGIVSQGVFFRYRVLGNSYAIFPIPGDGEVFNLYYISENWVLDQITGSPKSSVTASGDIPLFDKRLLVSGLKVKLWGQKGFDTTILQNEFDYALRSEKGQNQGAPVIGLSTQIGSELLSIYNVPDHGYGT